MDEKFLFGGRSELESDTCCRRGFLSFSNIKSIIVCHGSAREVKIKSILCLSDSYLINSHVEAISILIRAFPQCKCYDDEWQI